MRVQRLDIETNKYCPSTGVEVKNKPEKLLKFWLN